jgi:hypothetical protein
MVSRHKFLQSVYHIANTFGAAHGAEHRMPHVLVLQGTRQRHFTADTGNGHS